MRPGFQSRLIRSIGQSDIQCIERDEQLVRAPDFGKRFEDPRLCARIPDELLMDHGVLVECVDLTMYRQVFCCPC